MKNKSHITYDQLLEITSWGVFAMNMKGKSVSDKRLSTYDKIEDAMYGGIYTGSPGRDIYFMLAYLSEDQMKEVASKLSGKFPRTPPKNYVNVAACVRFIYGQFEKQGILRSEEDFGRMKKEKLDWELSRKFLKILTQDLNRRNNYYGLSMLYEMEGHRLGDEAVINNDLDKLNDMENNYNKCVKYAVKCKDYKHMFSIYYWAFEYFKKFGDTKNAIKYAKLSIKNATMYYRKYFPNGESYYAARLGKAFSYVDKNDDQGRKDFRKKYKTIVNDKFKK